MYSRNKQIVIASAALISLFLGVAFFVWTVVPYTQMSMFFRALRKNINGNPTALLNTRAAFYPMTYIQNELRYQFAEYTLKQYFAGNITADDSAIVELAASRLDEAVTRGDNYPEHYLNLGRIYDLLSGIHVKDARTYQDKAALAYEHALSIFPGNQRILYAYMINLSYRGKLDEALVLAKQVLDSDDRVPESHYYYGALLFSKDNQANAVSVLENLEFALEKDIDPLPELTRAMYQRLLVTFYNKGDVVHILPVLERLKNRINRDQAETYQKVIDYIKANKMMPVLHLQ